MSDKGYNGWTNRETWAVALHINNDQGSQEQAEQMARDAIANHADEDANDVKYELADALKDWITDEIEEATERMGTSFGAYLVRDLLSDDIDWHEIAESFIEAVHDET